MTAGSQSSPPSQEHTSLRRYAELIAKVDAFFARVALRHAGRMRCRVGCSDCCRVQLTVTAVEAAAVLAGLDSMESGVRRRLAARALLSGLEAGSQDGARRCAALDDDGTCGIYAFRPLVCRSHGVPVRADRDGEPTLEACPHNFVSGEIDAVAPDDILNQATLSTLLAAVNALYAREHAVEPERILLAHLLAGSNGR
jgi:uncharacterized protein